MIWLQICLKTLEGPTRVTRIKMSTEVFARNVLPRQIRETLATFAV